MGRRVQVKQMALAEARKPSGHGGWRPGAGRKRGKNTVSHLRRPAFGAQVPQHVTIRLAAGVASIRKDKTAKIVRGAILAGGHRDDFRVVHFNVLSNHIHLLVEAEGEQALARGMQALGVRLAKRLNGALGRRGRLFSHRYHARSLKTPREVRNAIRYVLLNARHHAAEQGRTLARTWIDPYSSAPWFDGWRQRPRVDQPWLRALLRTQCPTALPRVWLLTTGWWQRGGGPIGVDEVPGRQKVSVAGREKVSVP